MKPKRDQIGKLLDRLIREYGDVLKTMAQGPMPSMEDMVKGIDLIGVEMRRLRSDLNNARNAVRIYGDHLTSCKKRPCTCGFKREWDEHAAKADHPGKRHG